MTCGALYAQSQDNLPLNTEERRQVLGQLYELQACREETKMYEIYVSRETALDTKEKENADRALELEKQATALAEKERDLALEKAKFYEDLYRTVTKKPGIGCRILRKVTLGIIRCN
jgi:hypothetical protein